MRERRSVSSLPGTNKSADFAGKRFREVGKFLALLIRLPFVPVCHHIIIRTPRLGPVLPRGSLRRAPLFWILASWERLLRGPVEVNSKMVSMAALCRSPIVIPPRFRWRRLRGWMPGVGRSSRRRRRGDKGRTCHRLIFTRTLSHQAREWVNQHLRRSLDKRL